MALFKKSKKIVGLDIGSSSLKLVELKPFKKGKEQHFALEALGYEPLPYQAIVEGSIMDSFSVIEAIQHVFYESKASSTSAAIGVSGNGVIVKRIEVSRVPADQLEQLVLHEARPHIPFNENEVNLDYEIIESPEISSDRLGVILAAVKKDRISDYINVVTSANKNPEIFDLDCFALLNCILFNYEMYRDRVLFIINIGASTTNIIFARNGFPVFVRDIPMAGNIITDILQRELNIKFDKAELAKKGRSVEGVSPAAVQPYITMSLETICSEIKKTLDFYRTTSIEGRVDNILISGGSSNLTGLLDYFSQHFDIPVEVVNPFNNIEINYNKFDINFIREMAPLYAVAVGLALRAVGS